jgi:hypothetical protein
MISGARRSDSAIIDQMRKPSYKLSNVNTSYGNDNNKGNFNRKRTKCDLCAMIPPKNEQLDFGACFQKGNSRACILCYLFGRTCCSWTNNVKVLTLPENLWSPEKITQTTIVRNPLMIQRVPRLPSEHQDFDHNVRALKDLAMPEDDADEAEPEDADEEDNEESGDESDGEFVL